MLVALAVSPAGADTRDELDRARAYVDQTQAAADALAARYEDAVARHAEISNAVEVTRSRIEDAEKRMAELRAAVQEFAVSAYTGGGAALRGTDWLNSDDVLDLSRRRHILELATEPQSLSLDEFEALRDDLERDRGALEQATDEAARLVTELEDESDALQAQLLDAQRAQADLQEQLAQEEAQQRAEEEQRRLEAERQLVAEAQRRAQQPRPNTPPTTARATPPATPTTPVDRAPDAAPPSDAAPPAGAIVCPIRGALSFVDSWGAPRSGGRSHQGVDLMSPQGTPNVAVVSGEVRQKEGNLSGISVYLYGDDGNTYWYFHLSAFEGPPRRVQQGEVIGYVGSSGNASASAPHTHFEYHPGGGPAVNPYPLTRSAC